MADQRLNILTGSPWEPLRGFSRAVRSGNYLFISGISALTPTGEVVGAGDAYVQTQYIIRVVKRVLEAAEFQFRDIVRTRLYVTADSRWDDFARAHREAFESIRPASTLVQVSKLFDHRLLVEMEVDALRGEQEVTEIKISPPVS